MTQKQIDALADTAVRLGHLYLCFRGGLAELDPLDLARDYRGHPLRSDVDGIAMAGLLIADQVGRKSLLMASAMAIAAYSGFAPQLLDAGPIGETTYMVVGFVLLGLSFGQSSGAIASNFARIYRYTASALTSDLAWLFGAGFAPLAALLLASSFGLISAGAYLLSGAAWTLVALWLSGRHKAAR